jgi:Secretion system C-terminal sorting domain
MKLKIKILFILLNLCLQLNGQTIRRIDFVANDIVFAPQHNSIYATAPSANKAFGNTVCRIDPTTGLVKQSVFVGTEPTFLAVSGDGQYLYVGLEYLPRIIRMKLPDLKPDLTILTTDTSQAYQGVLYPEDIKVLPNQPNSIAVMQGHYSSPSFSNIVVYDNGVMRPDIGYDRLNLSDVTTMTFLGNKSDTLIGASTNTISFIPIKSSGFESPTQSYRDKMLGYDQFIKYSSRDSLLYTGMRILNPRSNPRLNVVYTFNLTDFPFTEFNSKVIVEPDPLADAFFMSYNAKGKLLFKRYNTVTRFLTAEWTLLNASFEKPKQIINLGKPEKMALLSNNHIFLIDNKCISTITTTPVITQSNSLVLCNDSSVILSVNTNQNVLWSTGDTSISIKVKAAGKYSVSFLDNQGCAGASSLPIDVSQTASPNQPYINASDPNLGLSREMELCQGEKISIKATVFDGSSVRWSNGESNQQLIITQEGQYYAIATNSAGCKTSSFIINVKYKNQQTPSKPSIKALGKTDLCTNNEPLTLQAPAGYSNYRWSNFATTQNITVSPFYIDSFAVKVSNTEGCTSEWSDFVKVRRLSTPPKPILVYKDSLLQSTNTTQYSHRWFLNGDFLPNLTNVNYKPNSAGFYTVQAYLGQCDSPFSDWSNVALSVKTAVESIPEFGFLQVYPNPTDGNLRIQIITELKGGTIEMINTNGETIINKKVLSADNQIEISISALPSGAYILVWKSFDGVVRGSKKIIKN